MEKITGLLNNIIWSPALIYLCLLSGLYFSAKMRFPQVRHFGEMVRLVIRGKSSSKGITSFQAFAVSLSGRVGTGNIAGVATAIALGGPGAVVWMWIIAFVGAGSAYVESALGQIYKVEKDGEYRGGPAYYIEKGLGNKAFAVVFAIASIIAMGFFMPGIQSNSIGAGIENAFSISPTYTGIFLIIVLAAIIFGGIKRIGKVAEFVVPFMAIAYILVSLVIIGLNIGKVPGVFALMFSSAFGVNATFGGIVGTAISWGVKRGIYSNEAGQGTGPHAAAAAEVSHPAKQGLVQAFSVYVDTLFVCTATALMILITGMYNVETLGIENLAGVEIGPGYTQAAVDSVFPGIGSAFVAIALLFFAFTTIMAYYYMAETNITYLEGVKTNKWVLNIFRLLFLGMVFYGVTSTAGSAWALGDIGVGLMAWLNIIAIILLRKPAFDSLKDYEEQKKAGLDPVYKPSARGIANAEYWEQPSSNKEEVS